MERLKIPHETAEPDKSYTEEVAINGMDIRVMWDPGYNEYVVYFPQIELGDAASAFGVHDQLLLIGEDSEEAKQIFETAKQIATSEGNPYKTFLQLEESLSAN